MAMFNSYVKLPEGIIQCVGDYQNIHWKQKRMGNPRKTIVPMGHHRRKNQENRIPSDRDMVFTIQKRWLSIGYLQIFAT